MSARAQHMSSGLYNPPARRSNDSGGNRLGMGLTPWAALARNALPITQAAEQIMLMPAHTAPRRRWTEDEFYLARDAAPPGERWELVDGEVLVTPSPNWVHQRIAFRLAVLLDSYVRVQRLGDVFTAPLDV